MDLKRFAKCLEKTIRAREARVALVRSISRATWTAGGCWTLAHAVAGLVDGELWALMNHQGRVNHVVVKAGEWYLDGDGLSTREVLLQRWQQKGAGGTVEHRIGPSERPWDRSYERLVPVLAPFTPEHQREAASHDVRCDTRVITAILPALVKCARKR